MTINRKLNYVPLAIEELRPGNMVYCWGVKICGQLTKDPQHFIVTDTDRLTGYIMIEWAGELPFKVNNPTPTPPYYFDKIITAVQDVFHQEERHISEIRAVELWDRKAAHDQRIKSFGFIAHPGKIYTCEMEGHLVKLTDMIAKKHSVNVQIAREGERIHEGELWYVHELQNIVFKYAGLELENSLTRRIMIDRPGKNLLSAK
jgi:hypothetical protein